MKITEVYITKIHQENRKNQDFLGFATVVFDGDFVVNRIKIVRMNRGIALAMPSRETLEGRKDIVHPATPEFRKYIEQVVLEKFNGQMDIHSIEAVKNKMSDCLKGEDF